jgi:hypothetical protein
MMRSLRLKPLLALVAAGFCAAAVALPAVANAAPAADPMLNATYPVNGTSTINATTSSLTLGPGTLTASLDTTTLAFTGNLDLPPATGSFTELGFVPVTATAEFVQEGAITGTDVDGGISATAHISIKLTKVTAAGLPILVGNHCQTLPAEIDLTSGDGFNVLLGGPVSGTFTIPPFLGCGLNTGLLNAIIPGPGNTISLTLGTPAVTTS